MNVSRIGRPLFKCPEIIRSPGGRNGEVCGNLTTMKMCGHHREQKIRAARRDAAEAAKHFVALADGYGLEGVPGFMHLKTMVEQLMEAEKLEMEMKG